MFRTPLKYTAFIESRTKLLKNTFCPSSKKKKKKKPSNIKKEKRFVYNACLILYSIIDLGVCSATNNGLAVHTNNYCPSSNDFHAPPLPMSPTVRVAGRTRSMASREAAVPSCYHESITEKSSLCLYFLSVNTLTTL